MGNDQIPVKLLTSDFKAFKLQPLCQTLLSQMVHLVESAKNVENISWNGPMGVFSQEGLNAALVPGRVHEESVIQKEAQSENMEAIRQILHGREPIELDELTDFQIVIGKKSNIPDRFLITRDGTAIWENDGRVGLPAGIGYDLGFSDGEQN